MNPPTPTASPSLAAVLTLLCATGSLGAQEPAAIDVPWDDSLPPGTPAHVTRALAESSRHGEWVDIGMLDGSKLNSWVVYPERKDPAGVVLVIHDIRGMSDWIRAVGDQLAQDGFVAIVPDFLSGKGPNGGGTASLGSDVGQAIRKLTVDEVAERLDSAMAYGKKLPAANGKTGVIGFCWGGTQSFGYALAQPKLAAAVVYYGNVPGSTATEAPEERIAKIAAPVLGLYGGNDARIDATLPPTEAAMKRQQKVFEPHIFEGAGHGFLNRQDGADGKNLAAAQKAWPLTLTFLRQHLAASAAVPAAGTKDQGKDKNKDDRDARLRELLDATGVTAIALTALQERFKLTQDLPAGFLEELGKRATPQHVADLLVPIYKKHLDAETVEALLAFYRSPAGTRLQKVQPAIAQEARAAMRAWGEELANEVMRALGR